MNACGYRCYKRCVNVLGLVTARGGSKGIPGKNLVRCGGKPLLAWTAEAARDARCLTRTVISTDDPTIAEYARNAGLDAPFLRPAELATDTATSIDVAIHALEWLRVHERWVTDVLVLLQPTSPLRLSRHIDEAFALLAIDADSVCSVMEVPHRFNPWTVLRLDDGHLFDYHAGELPFDRHRRQGQPKLYARNGPVVIVTRAATIMARSFYGERSVPYFMSSAESIDIDDREDLAVADWLLNERASDATAR
jgi:CMP-N-acetylneuraminic acid synthetase